MSQAEEITMADAHRNPTPSEWVLMKALWRLGPSTVRQVRDAVLDEENWAYTTVKTMLERMERKGLLTVKRVGPVKQFASRIRRRDLVPRAVERFLDNVLDGSLAPLVPYIAKTRGLTEREVRDLRRILEKESDS
jgi:predicted transcriptional regulator